MENNINDIVKNLSFPTDGKILIRTEGNVQLGILLSPDRINREYVIHPSDHLLPDGEYECNLFEEVLIAADYIQEGQPVPTINNKHYITLKSSNN